MCELLAVKLDESFGVVVLIIPAEILEARELTDGSGVVVESELKETLLDVRFPAGVGVVAAMVTTVVTIDV